jgi:hypothetical protein
VTTIGLVGFSLKKAWNLVDFSGWSGIRFHELLIVVVILGAILVAVRASSRPLADAALGVVGYSIVKFHIIWRSICKVGFGLGKL